MEKPIQFGIGILEFSRKRGGAEKYLVDLCAQLARENYEVHVYAGRWDEEGGGPIHFHSVKTLPVQSKFLHPTGHFLVDTSIVS